MPHIQTRKIVRIGNTSFGVIIPIEWLRYYNLGYGDRVEVTSSDVITIKPEGSK